MTSFRSSMKKIDCPDGPRYFLRNPEKAFAINFSEWNVRISELLNLFSKWTLSGNQEISLKNKIIVKNLTERYAALQSHYQTAYLGWYANPCSKDAEQKFHEAKDLICTKELELTEIEKISALIIKGSESLPHSLEVEPHSPQKGDRTVRKKQNHRRKSTESQTQVFQGLLGERTAYSLDDEFTVECLDKIQKLVSKLKI